MRRLLVAVLVLVARRPAEACMPFFERGIVGAPAFEPADAVAITSETVDVQCDEQYTCTVTSTFDIAVAKPARATITGYKTAELTLAASGPSAATVSGRTVTVTTSAPASGTPAAAPDAKATATLELVPADNRLKVHARVAVPEYIDGCFTDGVIARHPYLASAPAGNQHILEIHTTTAPRVHAPKSWSLDVDTRTATKYDPALTRLWFTVPSRVITLGGPVLLIGAASGTGRTFRARGMWEAAIKRPWLVLALAGETDFADEWSVALTAEPTTSAWILPLSFGAGGGVVLANGRRVGGRVQVSIALGAVRVLLSADTVSATDGSGTDTTAVALIGGGL